MRIEFITDDRIRDAFIWGVSLVISLPFLIAIYRKLKGLSMIFSEMAMKSNEAGKYNIRMRRIVAEIIPVVCMLGVLLIIIALSAGILPPLEMLMLVLFIVVALTVILWSWFIKLHSRLQAALMDSLGKKDKIK